MTYPQKEVILRQANGREEIVVYADGSGGLMTTRGVSWNAGTAGQIVDLLSRMLDFIEDGSYWRRRDETPPHRLDCTWRRNKPCDCGVAALGIVTELEHILGSVYVPHARNGRMVPLLERAREFVDHSHQLHRIKRDASRMAADDTAPAPQYAGMEAAACEIARAFGIRHEHESSILRVMRRYRLVPLSEDAIAEIRRKRGVRASEGSADGE